MTIDVVDSVSSSTVGDSFILQVDHHLTVGELIEEVSEYLSHEDKDKLCLVLESSGGSFSRLSEPNRSLRLVGFRTTVCNKVGMNSFARSFPLFTVLPRLCSSRGARCFSPYLHTGGLALVLCAAGMSVTGQDNF